MMEKKTKTWVKIGIGLSAVVLLFYLFRFSPLKDALSIDSIQTFLQGFGMWGPVVYIVMYIVLTVMFFPASVLTISGGFVFGLFWGTIYAIIGATIAATVAFLIARYLAKDWVEKTSGKTFKKYNKKLSEKGFETVAILRLLFLPYIPLSYAAGASSVSLVAFILATFLTNIPGGFAFAYLGQSITNPKTIAIAVVMIVLVMMIPKLVKKILAKKGKNV